MYIEDLIAALANNYFISVKQPHLTAVHSLYLTDQMGTAYTEKQKYFAISIIKNYTSELSKIFNTDVTQFLSNPVTRRPLRVLSNIKQITLATNEIWGKVIHVMFPYNEEIISEIRKNKKDLDYLTWDEANKLWLYVLTEKNISEVYRIGVKYQFDMSEDFMVLANAVNAVIDNIESHIPMLTLHDGIPVYKNVPPNVPKLTTSDIVMATFEARASGVTTWDDNIESILNNGCANTLIKDFLIHSSPGQAFKINPKVYTKSEVCMLLSYLKPCVFLLAGNNVVLEQLVTWHQELNALGVPNSDISVMFRLDSTHNNALKFNQYVKDQGLNNPLSTTTQAVFISDKVPKPLVASGIDFASVVTSDTDLYPRYTTKLFLDSLPNIIHYYTSHYG